MTPYNKIKNLIEKFYDPHEAAEYLAALDELTKPKLKKSVRNEGGRKEITTYSLTLGQYIVKCTLMLDEFSLYVDKHVEWIREHQEHKAKQMLMEELWKKINE